MPTGGNIEIPPDFYEDRGRMHTLPHEPLLRRPTRKPRFEKGSQEAKDYMASIRNNKQGSGFFNNLGKSIKKEANKGKRSYSLVFISIRGKRVMEYGTRVLELLTEINETSAINVKSRCVCSLIRRSRRWKVRCLSLGIHQYSLE